MAQEITIDINIVTNAAPAAAKISKELDGVKRKAKEVKDDLDAAFDDTGKGDGKIKKGTQDVETLKNALSPIKGLVSDLTGGMSDAFFQAFQSVKATTTAIKGLDLALKTAAFGIFILVIQEAIKLYDQLVVSEEEEAAALKAATDAKKAYKDATLAAADALDKERKARSDGANSIRREVAELEASGATAEQILQKKKDLNFEEKRDLLAKQSFLYDDAQAQKDIAQALLDNASALRVLELADDKRVADIKAANAAKSKAQREADRKEQLAAQKALSDAIAALDKETIDLLAGNREAAIKDELERENERFANLQDKLANDRNAQVIAANGNKQLIAATNAKFDALEVQAAQTHATTIEGINKTKDDKLLAQNQQAADINRNLIANEQMRELANLQAAFDAQYAAAEGNAELRLALQNKFNADVAKVNDDAQKTQAAKDKAYRQQLQDLSVDSALGTISALKELNGIFDADNEEAAKKSFNRNKALSIVETLITTFTAAQKAYASQLIVGDPTSVIRAQIAAGVAVAGGLARVAAISATKFNSSGVEPSAPSASSAAGSGAASVPAPQFNIVGQSGTNQLAQSIGGQFQQPIRAYVVGGDVTTSQQLQRQRVRTATFG
jgi:hypothetical protein